MQALQTGYMLLRILLLCSLLKSTFSTRAGDIEGLIWSKSDSVPSFILVRSYVNQSVTDTIRVLKDGYFKIPEDSNTFVQKRILIGNSTVDFVCNNTEQNVKLLIETYQNKVTHFNVIDSDEQKAYNELVRIAELKNSKLMAVAMQEESIDKVLNESSKLLNKLSTQYPHTYTVKKLLMLVDADRATSVEAYCDSLLGRLTAFSPESNTTPIFAQQLHFYIRQLLRFSAPNPIWVSDWLDKYRNEPHYQKFIAQLLFQNLLYANSENTMQALMDYCKALDYSILPEGAKKQMKNLSSEMPGNALKEINAINQRGNRLLLNENALQKKPFNLFVFWDLECSNCHHFINQLRDLRDNGKLDHVGIVTIAIAPNMTNWEKAIRTFPIEWLNFTTDPGMLSNWTIISTPTLVLADKDNIILSRLNSPDAVIKMLLTDLPKGKYNK